MTARRKKAPPPKPAKRKRAGKPAATAVPQPSAQPTHPSAPQISDRLRRAIEKLDPEEMREVANLLAQAWGAASAAAATAPKPDIRPGLPPLSRDQMALARFLFNTVQATGVYPTPKEIATKFEMPQHYVAMYLRPLADKGYLKHVRRGEWHLTDEALRVLAA